MEGAGDQRPTSPTPKEPVRRGRVKRRFDTALSSGAASSSDARPPAPQPVELVVPPQRGGLRQRMAKRGETETEKALAETGGES